MPHKIAISIINYRTGDLTIQSIASVLPELAGYDAEVIVVDNLSGDGSAEQIADWISSAKTDVPIRLVHSSSNSGFSGGHNQGFAASDADFVLVLNSDAVLRPGFFAPLLAAAEKHPHAGLIAPRLEDPDTTPQVNCFRFHSPISEMLRSASTGPLSKIFKNHEVALGINPDPSQIEWVSFACVLLRRTMIDALGPMDEGYFLYYEDSEYCLRAARAGWACVFVPEARAVHFRGGSGPVKALQSARKRLPPYYYSSRSRFMFQAYGRTGPIRANIGWILGRGVAHMRRLTGRKPDVMALSEARDIWINALTPDGDRNATS